jgi:hypothetical protein
MALWVSVCRIGDHDMLQGSVQCMIGSKLGKWIISIGELT